MAKAAPRPPHHHESHRTDRIGWLRAAVLGANDGIVSTSSLLSGVAAASTGRAGLLVAGVAGLVSGALSMAAGEYVSVRSQADAEDAELAQERRELALQPDVEKQELASIYIERGLTPELAAQVAEQLTARDALGSHARDELGLSEDGAARPVQAALASAASFSAGALAPIVAAVVAPPALVLPLVAAASLALLAGLGALSARLGHAPVLRPALRVAVLGAMAMALTAAVGKLFGTVL